MYIAYRNTYGYSEPEQIPGFVNTMGNERNPYLLNDSILIFTSDGILILINPHRYPKIWDTLCTAVLMI